MFKKPVKIGAQNQLSGKDKKGIKNKLIAQYDEESVEKLLAQSDKIICNKITGSKMLIYVSDQYPLFVDGTGKEDYFPSLYVCAAYEPLTKSVIINEGVEGYIFNGANLMWPGVRDFTTIGNFKKDQIVSIKTSKGEVIGVGAMGCSLDELKKNTDGSGVAVFILHYRGDKLWDMGDKIYPDVIVKGKQVKLEAPKIEVKPQVKQKPQELKAQEKLQVKKEQNKSEDEPQAEKPKGRGKKVKGDKLKEQKEQSKPVSKAPVKKQSEQQQEDDDDNFAELVHSKKPQKPQAKIEKKKGAIFSDQQDDKKGKKKAGRKGGNKKKQSDDDEQAEIPKPKQQTTKGKAKKQEQLPEEQQQQKEHKKGKKGKNKKHHGNDEDEVQDVKEEKETKKKNVKKEKKKQESDQEPEETEIKQEKPKVKKADDDDEEEQHEEGPKSAISGQLMDQYFKEAFLNVLKLSKVEAELPIDSGRFFSDYMVLARPQGVKLDIKQSTFKKLGKFYEQMAKLKFIEFKPAKEKKGQQGSTITKILWETQELKNYFPNIKRLQEKDVQQKQEQYSKYKLKLTKNLQVEYVYKINEQLKKILFKKVVNYMPTKQEEEEMESKKEEEKKEIFLSEKELREKIQKYINEIAVKQAKETKQVKQPKEGKQPKENKQGKQAKQKGAKTVEKLITLNYKQNEFIFNILKHEIEQYEQNLAKQEMMAQHDSDQQEKKKNKKDKHKKSLFRMERGYIVNKIFKLATPYYNMLYKDTNVNKFKQGVFKGIQIIADKIINKNVTKILGLEVFAPTTEPEELVKQIHGFANMLQLRFASSASVQNLPGKNAGKEIVVQGNFVDELQTLFTTEYGIKQEYITVQNKLGKKKKKD